MLHDMDFFDVPADQLSFCLLQNLSPNQDFMSVGFLLARIEGDTSTLHPYSIPIRIEKNVNCVVAGPIDHENNLLHKRLYLNITSTHIQKKNVGFICNAL